MFNKFIRSISHINYNGNSNDFDTYLMGVQRSGKTGMATINEARKDYANAHRSDSRLLIP